MNFKDSIRSSLRVSDFLVQGYLADITPDEMLVRPVPEANHIAWQLGHLIKSEHQLMEGAYPGKMPPLPAGFAEKYTKETSTIDAPQAFHKKAEFLKLYSEQRAGTKTLLDKVTDSDLDKPGPEAFRAYCPTIAALFALQGSHWLMHAGQWAVIRRKLGRPPLF